MFNEAGDRLNSHYDIINIQKGGFIPVGSYLVSPVRDVLAVRSSHCSRKIIICSGIITEAETFVMILFANVVTAAKS